MRQILNLTPHVVTITYGRDAGTYPSAGLARLASLPLGDVEGLPPPQAGTRYIVSILVAERLPARDDLVVPGDQTRDGEGKITGARSLKPAREASPALAMLLMAAKYSPPVQELLRDIGGMEGAEQ